MDLKDQPKGLMDAIKGVVTQGTNIRNDALVAKYAAYGAKPAPAAESTPEPTEQPQETPSEE